MKFKVHCYSNEKLFKELYNAKMRLEGYLQAKEALPESSKLGVLYVSCGIRYEEALIAALDEEIHSRGL